MLKILEFQKLVDDLISKQNFKKSPHELYDPIAYIMSQGGKRLRPVLTLLSCDLFDGDIQKALYPALAIEVFHNFTLVHDDIMDKAPIRRGLETIYKKWNADIAILSGDTMFAMAYQYALLTDATLVPDILGVFSKTAVEVCEGQQLDMNFENQNNVGINDYLQMIHLKTAVLLGASLKIGAIIGGASSASTQAIYDFGVNLGIAFQLKDDLLDVYGSESKFGKMSGGDIATNKKTYLYLKACELANKEQLELLKSHYSNTSLDQTRKIAEVKQIFDDLAIESHVVEAMQKYYDNSLSSLEMVESKSEKKNDLKAFATQLYNRNY